jgi:hypothetical protein
MEVNGVDRDRPCVTRILGTAEGRILKVIRRSEPKDCSTKKGTPFRSMEK